MTEITPDHVEWAVVNRLQKMLEQPAHDSFNVTETYALFTATLCWVMQRIRIPETNIRSKADQIAHILYNKLSDAKISADPWSVHVAPTPRITAINSHAVSIPAPVNFETHSVSRFLINLRDATAHGDARNVAPFNMRINSEWQLGGFTFSCAELTNRKMTWKGKITLLETDMRRIGTQLTKIYCEGLRRSEPHKRDSYFGRDAASIREAAA